MAILGRKPSFLGPGLLAFSLGLATPAACGALSVRAGQEAASARHAELPRAGSGPTQAGSAVRRWAPPDVDEQVPPVAPGVACSLPQLLEGAGQRVKELVANLEQFTATERIEHEEVSAAGDSRGHRSRAFTYLVTLREIRPGMLSVDETRDGDESTARFPTQLATRGLPALALIFHPYYAEDFQMTCEGLGEFRGQPAWQVRFQQRPDKPSRISAFQVRTRSLPVKLKGRAWIAPETYQVLRLETDLMEPLPEIRLERSHKAIEYRPVQFQERNVELWLPEKAEIFLHLRGQRYRHRHTFTDFLLFSVQTKQQIAPPRQP